MSLLNLAYQSVQTILNKNSRGVLSPERFNILANQSQIDIYSQTISQYRTVFNRAKQNKSGLDMNDIEQQLIRFLKSFPLGVSGNDVSEFTTPDDFSFFPDKHIFYEGQEVAEIPMGQLGYFTNTSIVSPSTNYPQYKKIGNTIKLYPSLEDNKVEVIYYRNPLTPKWTYQVVDGEALFNPSAADYQELDLDERRLNDFIVAVLELAGVHLRDQIVIQVSEALKNSEYTKDNTP